MTNEIGLFLFMSAAAFLWALMAYTAGYKNGHKDGFNRGRTLRRHAASQEVSK